MKKIVFISLVIVLIIGNCAQEEKSPIEGAWKLISGKTSTQDTIISRPVSVNGNHMKIIGKKYFSTIWQDTTISKSNFWYAGFNGGAYTIENGVYTETEMYFNTLSRIGSKVSFKVEFENDTMVLTYIPNDPNSKVTGIEKWKRLE